MIFVTVGSQLPFDRLVRAVDEWCSIRQTGDVFGQIADPGPGGYRPRNFAWERFLHPEEYDRHFRAADLIVAHAGMGSIIMALMSGKPIVVMPRQASLMEHRNDHQQATARKFSGKPNLFIVNSDIDLADAIDIALTQPQTKPSDVKVLADRSLIDALRRFITSPANDPKECERSE